MTRFKTLGWITAICLIMVVVAAFIPKKQPINTAKGFAVLELFTSEGCSSCPPADELVAKIQQENKNQPVYILAYHVDYWNRLGWKDVFSSPAFSARQKQYASWLNLDGVYTPQAIINGRKEFIASEAGTMRNVLKQSLQNAAVNQLVLSDVNNNNNRIELNYQTDKISGSVALVLAIVQKTATTQVKSGENGGRTLSHVQIVRQLQTIALGGTSGKASLNLPEHLNLNGLELIAFLQNIKTGEITAAAKSAVPAANVLTQVHP